MMKIEWWKLSDKKKWSQTDLRHHRMPKLVVLVILFEWREFFGIVHTGDFCQFCEPLPFIYIIISCWGTDQKLSWLKKKRSRKVRWRKWHQFHFSLLTKWETSISLTGQYEYPYLSSNNMIQVNRPTWFGCVLY